MRVRLGSRGRVGLRRRRGDAGRVLPSILLVLFLGLGLFLLWVMVAELARTIDSYRWPETECLILDGDVVVPAGGDGEFVYRVTYRYRAGGRDYTGDVLRPGYDGSGDSADAYRLAAAYPAGARVPCWVDPDHPASAFLDHRSLWYALILLLPLAFVAAGGGGLWLLWGRGRKGARGGAAAAAGRAPKPVEALGKKFTGGHRGCLAAFFGVFLLAGLGIGWLVILGPAVGALRARSWVATDCEVVSSGVETHSGDDGDTYSVEILYRYRHRGREYHSNRYHFFTGSSSGYGSKARVVEGYPEGRRFTCWVDPDDPAEAVIERGLGGEIWIGLVPLVFVLVGGGGVAWAIAGGRRRRRRAAGDRAAGARTATPTLLPAGPVALDRGVGPLGRFFGLLFIAAFWNGITGVFVWQVIETWRAGSPDGCLTVFILPFVAIGLLLLVSVPHQLLALANPRPHLTLDPGAVPPGGSAELSWRFTRAAGRLRALKIELEQSETTTTRSANKVSSQTRPVHTATVFETDDRAEARAGSTRLTVPPDADPTSDEGDRRITWKLKVAGAIRYWPDVAQDFEFEVLPAPADTGPPIPPPPEDVPTGGGWVPPPAPLPPLEPR